MENNILAGRIYKLVDIWDIIQLQINLHKALKYQEPHLNLTLLTFS